jgi:hypothetical protein
VHPLSRIVKARVERAAIARGDRVEGCVGAVDRGLGLRQLGRGGLPRLIGRRLLERDRFERRGERVEVRVRLRQRRPRGRCPTNSYSPFSLDLRRLTTKLMAVR